MNTEKVIIIGGGPAGLAAAIYNSRADLKPLVIAGSPPGGQLILTTEVENYPGFESILGPELIVKMRQHAEKFGTRFVDENVLSVDASAPPFKLYVGSKKQEYMAESILIASGADALWLNLPSEQRLRGKGVSACATCDGFFFKNKVVGVVGGGDTALEEALTLTHFASKVYIIHRKTEFRASKIMQQRVLTHSKIEIIWNATVIEVLGENKVEGVKLSGGKDLVVDGLFIAIGHKPATAFLKNSGVLVDQKGYVMTGGLTAWEKIRNPQYDGLQVRFNPQYQYVTSVDGVFAAGDVVDPHYRQAATAVGMGVSAALELERYLMLTKK